MNYQLLVIHSWLDQHDQLTVPTVGSCRALLHITMMWRRMCGRDAEACAVIGYPAVVATTVGNNQQPSTMVDYPLVVVRHEALLLSNLGRSLLGAISNNGFCDAEQYPTTTNNPH